MIPSVDGFLGKEVKILAVYITWLATCLFFVVAMCVHCVYIAIVFLVDGVDYNGTDAYVLTFNAGDTQQCLNIQILDDFLPELNDEQFLVNLSSTDAGIFRSLATVIIEDNDQGDGTLTC